MLRNCVKMMLTPVNPLSTLSYSVGTTFSKNYKDLMYFENTLKKSNKIFKKVENIDMTLRGRLEKNLLILSKRQSFSASRLDRERDLVSTTIVNLKILDTWDTD